MNNITIETPNREKIHGSVCVPPSKSIAHRAIICAKLAKGVKMSFFNKLLFCDDTLATFNAFKTYGFTYCGESGSTLRFLIPIFAALKKGGIFVRCGKLPERPLTPYFDVLPSHGVYITENSDKLVIIGKLKSGKFELPGDVSSQFITGLLLAFPLLDGNSEIVLKNPLESAPYVDLTIDTMESFGVHVTKTKNGYKVKGNQQYKKPEKYAVESDMSAAAFWIVANAVCGNSVNIQNLPEKSRQGDAKILDIVSAENKFIDVDVTDIPDIAPILAVYACSLPETSYIRNCGRLRIKECDRLTAITTELRKLGANIEVTENDDMIIHGGHFPADKSVVEIDSWNDHRIAMSMGIASIVFERSVIIKRPWCVEKSYACFWEDLKKIGVKWRKT